MERDAARPPSSRPDPQSPPRRPALPVLVGLPLAACIVTAALVFQSSYGGGAKLDLVRVPQLVSTPLLPPGNALVQVAAAGAAPPPAMPPGPTVSQDATPTAPRPALTAPQDAMPSAAAALPPPQLVSTPLLPPEHALVQVAAAGAAPSPAAPPAPTVSQDATPTAPRPALTAPQDAMPSAAAALPPPQLVSYSLLPPEMRRFKWPRRGQHRRQRRPRLRPYRKVQRRQHPVRPRPRRRTQCRQLPRRFPITHSCCKQSPPISRICSETSNGLRQTSNRQPATIQEPLSRSRRARKK